MLTPICLFTYNRLEQTQLTVEALKNNFLAPQSDLIIFSDGPKNEKVLARVQEVRRYLKQIRGFSTVKIIESDENKGLANSIVSGVTRILKEYSKVIVLEDDLITSPNFLNFMNQALNYYENEDRIQTINAYSVYINEKNRSGDVYFQKRPLSWGWATWSDRWNKNVFDKKMIKLEIESDTSILRKFKKECGADISEMLLDSLNNRNDSWYVKWTYNHFKNNRFSVYPSLSLVENIGHGEASTHCKGINSYSYKLDNGRRTKFHLLKFVAPGSGMTREFLKYFTLKHKILFRIQLFNSSEGRRELFNEVNMRFKNILK